MTYLNIILLNDQIEFDITDYERDECSIKVEGPIAKGKKMRILQTLKNEIGLKNPCRESAELAVLKWLEMKSDLMAGKNVRLGNMEISRF